MKKAFIALLLLLNIFGNSIQLDFENKRFQKIKSFQNSLEKQLLQNNQLKGKSLERKFLFGFFYDLFYQNTNEFLSPDFITEISNSFTDIYLKNPNNEIRKKYFAKEIVEKLKIYFQSEENNNEENYNRRGRGDPPYNSFCIFIMNLFGMDEEYCE